MLEICLSEILYPSQQSMFSHVFLEDVLQSELHGLKVLKFENFWKF